jgi:hypothetical protein
MSVNRTFPAFASLGSLNLLNNCEITLNKTGRISGGATNGTIGT